jgi:3-deoxy-D-manno-octulosonic-acid transferase
MLLETHPDLLLVLVPRHPQRFAAVREMVVKQGMSVVSRTDGEPCSADTQVFLGDTMGELTLFYAASDVAFVAGSLVPIGGHNLLEPAALGLPLLSGPYIFNAQEIADMFVTRGACKLVRDAAELAAAVDGLLSDPETASRLGAAGREILERNRGSLARLMAMIEPLVA